MTRAVCQNDSCGHDWELQKAPGDYKNGVSCPSCGSTDVDITTGGGGGGQEQGNVPDTQHGGAQGQVAQQAGSAQPGAAASAFALLDGDVPAEEKARAAQGFFGGVGNVISQFLQFRQQKRQAMEERASKVELAESDLPTCKAEVADGEECGYQFGPEDIGLNTQRVRCPRCGSVYNLEGPA